MVHLHFLEDEVLVLLLQRHLLQWYRALLVKDDLVQLLPFLLSIDDGRVLCKL